MVGGSNKQAFSHTGNVDQSNFVPKLTILIAQGVLKIVENKVCGYFDSEPMAIKRKSTN